MTVVDASLVVDWVAPGADPDSPAMATLEALVARGDELQATPILLDEVAKRCAHRNPPPTLERRGSRLGSSGIGSAPSSPHRRPA
ncbi:MAG TPA: hypothetical protein VNF24_00635 [Candidatus Acidoferrales bacterium]|nr:hypothetical protein [Candidatus Acidoferrales bacterium]HVC23622.1 hypothetical protein [Candidatus Dormibacteraeota bacterium]